MSAERHIPGPWSVGGDGPARPYIVAACSSNLRVGCLIVAAGTPTGGQGWPRVGLSCLRANARLIAAAPDLLEALVALLEVSRHQCSCIDEPCPHDRAREVIARIMDAHD